MDLYTLTDTFLAKDVVDQFVSAIWTERYSSAGDVQIVAPATPENIAKLAEGTFLALRGSKEVMQLDTMSIENKLITVTGASLVEFLDERMAWFRNPATSPPADERIADLTREDMDPGEFIAYLVNAMVIDSTDFTGTFAPANLMWDDDVIPYLELGAVDTSGAPKKLTAVTGPLYQAIQQIAEKENLGISLYLEDADPVTGYTLKFTVYRGKDHTSDQSTNELIRLVPELDSLSNVKEVRSISNHKNVCYVYYQGIVTTHYEDPLHIPEGFNRRVLITDPDKEPVGHKETRDFRFGYGTITVVGPEDIAAFREQNARDALANHNYIRAIDGETNPQNDYKYGVHYGLGDIIELEGLTGTISKARITEFIRSHDQTGQKEYPTISVVTPESEA